MSAHCGSDGLCRRRKTECSASFSADLWGEAEGGGVDSCHRTALDLLVVSARREATRLAGRVFVRYLAHAAALGLTLGLAAALYVLLRAFVSVISPLAVETRATILAAMVTPVITVVTVILSHRYARRREIEQAQRARKIAFYSRFLKDYFELLGNWQRGKGLDRATRRKILELTKDTARGLILWGGGDTIEKYRALRDHASQGSDSEEQSDPSILIRFAELLLAIRKELGHAASNVQEIDLLSLFITDTGELKKH